MNVKRASLMLRPYVAACRGIDGPEYGKAKLIDTLDAVSLGLVKKSDLWLGYVIGVLVSHGALSLDGAQRLLKDSEL